jgi:hypothetical protein
MELTGTTGVVACRGQFADNHLLARGNLQLQQATLLRQPLTDVRSEFLIQDTVMTLKGIYGQLHEGQVYGWMRFDFDEKPVKFQVEMHASQIDLAKFASQTLDRSGQVHGKAFAMLALCGRGSDRTSMKGKGHIKIPKGKLYDLPLILDLLTFLSGKLPKGTAFEEAYAYFDIEGELMRVYQLDLLGDAISLRGQGDVQTDGRCLNLELYGLLWGRSLPLLPPLLDKIPPALSKRLMKLHINGSLTSGEKLDFRTAPLPVVVEPLRGLFESMSGRNQNPEAMNPP